MAATIKGGPAARRRVRNESRLDFRLSLEAKRKVEMAALASGLSTDEFAAAALQREAEEVLARLKVTKLSDRDRDVFLELMDNPSEPSEYLIRAVAEYNQRQRRHGGPQDTGAAKGNRTAS